MKSFKIVANGMEMGIYEAADKMGAIMAYTKDAGYKTIAAAAEVCGQTEEEYVSDLIVTEI